MPSDENELDRLYTKLEALEKELREIRLELGHYIRFNYPKMRQEKTKK